MAFTGMALAAALALAKNKLVDEPQANQERQLAANTQLLSPWTGLKKDQGGAKPNLFGDVMNYGAVGNKLGGQYGAKGKNPWQLPAIAGEPDPYTIA